MSPTVAHDTRRSYLEVAAISFVILFQELALIRWLPTQVRVVAYFPNVVLISAFLGLGVGCLLAGRRPAVELWSVGLVVTSLVAWAASRIAFTQESVTEHLWLLYHDLSMDRAPLVIDDIRLPIVAAFVLSGICFVPLGQMLASRIAALADRDRALPAYSFDLLGSLLGTCAFAFVSFLRTSPCVWFAVTFAVGLVFVARFGGRRVVAYVLCAAATIWIVQASNRALIFSPYYSLSLAEHKDSGGISILTNGSVHQAAFAIAPAPGRTSTDARRATDYLGPYLSLRKVPEKVLILGAGSGNDVATALVAGVKEIHAVEIDPEIIRLGREIHPNRPYDSPNVRVINDDARSYLNHTAEKYDLVVFGTLDSMTRLSALSSVRLDNFVYTSECLRSVRRVLRPGGGVVMYFMVEKKFVFDRLARLHLDAFGEPPIIVFRTGGPFSHYFLSGEAFAHVRSKDPVLAQRLAESLEDTEPLTDDWPFLYLQARGISAFYLSMIAMLALIACASVFGASPELRKSIRAGNVDVEMLCLGAAFLLLETKSVTEMNLAWGAPG